MTKTPIPSAPRRSASRTDTPQHGASRSGGPLDEAGAPNRGHEEAVGMRGVAFIPMEVHTCAMQPLPSAVRLPPGPPRPPAPPTTGWLGGSSPGGDRPSRGGVRLRRRSRQLQLLLEVRDQVRQVAWPALAVTRRNTAVVAVAILVVVVSITAPSFGIERGLSHLFQ